jgi:nucleoid-associated protein YgaU
MKVEAGSAALAAPAPKPSPVATVVAALPSPSPAADAKPALAPAATIEPSAGATPAASPSPASDALRIIETEPNDAGGLEAHGAAPPGAHVRLLLNGSYIADVIADASGRWSLTILRGLSAGFYALRAEVLDASGKTSASADMTFAYAPRPAAAGAPAGPLVAAAAGADKLAMATTNATRQISDPSHAIVAEIRTATVIKGDDLWDLARHYYGDGLRYVDILHANSSLIHNPNLIYIGQVLVVPQDPPKAP